MQTILQYKTELINVLEAEIGDLVIDFDDVTLNYWGDCGDIDYVDAIQVSNEGIETSDEIFLDFIDVVFEDLDYLLDRVQEYKRTHLGV